jgi:4-carboxymuconolactone decarboxylase
MKIPDRKTVNTLILLTVCFFSKTDTQAQDHRDKLNQKQQSIIAISAETASGNLKLLTGSLNRGLDNGLTINQIKEGLVHCYAYSGFPRSIRGLQTFMTVLEERKSKGITDVPGAEASPIDTSKAKYARGKVTLEKLTGSKETGPKTGYAAFAPVMEVFLKEHLFADIFDRNVLTYQDRELVTVSVISSIGDAEPMLRSHLSICLNVGLTPTQLRQFVQTIQPSIGQEKARIAQNVLDELLKSRKKN